MGSFVSDLLGGLTLDSLLVYICALRGIMVRSTGPSSLSGVVDSLKSLKSSRR